MHEALPTDIATLFVRNQGLVSANEQNILATSLILVAGCGSVGGCVVEPLVRLGIGALRLADPERFDLSNLNRQACVYADVGLLKVDVLAMRAKSINPNVEVSVLTDGIQPYNVEAAIDEVIVIVDGIDAETSAYAKYKLHECACRRRIPVLSGLDLGGTAVVYVFDYRRYKTLPFYGRAREADFLSGNISRCLSWVYYRDIPSDFLPVITSRLAAGASWPQLSYCVAAMSSLVTRTSLDIIMRRKVPHVVKFNVHACSQSFNTRLRNLIAWPSRMLRAYMASKVRRFIQNEEQVHGVNQATDYPQDVLVVVKAMISAPSPHNTQPWIFRYSDTRKGVDILLKRDRLLGVVDPLGTAAITSIGCALEAANVVANCRFDTNHENNILDEGYSAGFLYIDKIRHNWERSMALLNLRFTDRGPLTSAEIPDILKAELIKHAEHFGISCCFAHGIGTQLRDLSISGAVLQFGNHNYVDELLSHIRLTNIEERCRPYGFTVKSLFSSRLEWVALWMLKYSPMARRLLLHTPCHKIFARMANRFLRDDSYYLILSANLLKADDYIRLGRSLMRLWLVLTSSGFSCQPVDFPISNMSLRERLCSYLPDLKAEPVFVMRIGIRHDRLSFTHLRYPIEEFLIK